MGLISTSLGVYGADDWTQKYPSIGPPGFGQSLAARVSFSLCYISDGEVLMYGGYDADSVMCDYWIYDINENTWTVKTASYDSTRIYAHAMSYIGTNKAILFGGVVNSNYSDTTRIFDHEYNRFWKINPSTWPPGRKNHDLAYLGNNKVLLFGGVARTPEGFYINSNDTWIFDLADSSWTEITTSTTPAEREHHRMCYIGEGKVLLFGGYSYGTRYHDTWLFNLSDSTWTLKYFSSPTERYLHDMEYIGGDQVLLFGGQNGGPKNDTWIYDLSENHWILDDNDNKPSIRNRHQIARTSMDGSNYLVLFGGHGLMRYDETWTFGGGDYSLPVELSFFSADPLRQSAILVQWHTESEVENLGFILERREQESDWTEIATYLTHPELTGQGSVTHRTEYSLTDETVEAGRSYDYRLADVSFDGAVHYHSMMVLGVSPEELPMDFQLYDAYPNPFNPTTTISYTIPEQTVVNLIVFDIQGKEVMKLQNAAKPPGNYEVQWSGLDQSGSSVSTGVYFARLQAGTFSQTIKMVYLR